MVKFHKIFFLPQRTRNVKMKNLIVFAFVGLLSMAAVSCLRPNDLEVGHFETGQRLVLTRHVKKDKPPLLPIVIDTTETFSAPVGYVITQIRSIDQKFKNNNGASVALINGGPGQTFATLRYQSKRGHSIDHVVEIYGIPIRYPSPPYPNH